jgi:hypothetical protein
LRAQRVILVGGGFVAGEPLADTKSSSQSDIASAFGDKQLAYKMHDRQLDGIEMLGLVGLPFDDIKDFPLHELASKMAGNAFSAFAIGPVLLAALVGLTRNVVLQQLEAVEALPSGSSDDEEVGRDSS